MRIQLAKISHRLVVVGCIFGISALLGGCATIDRSQPRCATIDVDALLRKSKAAQAASRRLENEFKPRHAALDPLVLERNSAEKAWLDAKLAKQPDEMVATLQQKYDAARATESAAIRTVNQDLDRRRKEELKVLMEKVGVVYRKVGSESGYMLLFQASEAEPAYVFDHRYDHANCDTKDDLTQQVVDALNQSDAQTR